MLETIRELFQPFKFNLEVASSGNFAWEKIQKKHYHIVLSDVRMPDGDGLELLKKIKNVDPCQTSVFFMSGYSDLFLEEIYHFGAEGKFIKPFNFNTVKDTIERCFLSYKERWAKPVKIKNEFYIARSGVSIEMLIKEKKLFCGRGGFFIAHSQAPPQKDQQVVFDIKISDSPHFKFSGSGLARWNRLQNTQLAPSGFAVEIEHMSHESTLIYQSLFGQQIPYIPSPKKEHSQNK